MFSRYAQWKKRLTASHWALLFFVIVGCSFVCWRSCAPATKLTLNDDSETSIDLVQDSIKEFNKAKPICRPPNQPDFPVLYAHFLEQALNDAICSEDSIYGNQGIIDCAPGPVRLDQGSSVDSVERHWILPSMPDYFAWDLGPSTAVDESIYIAVANGSPIKSQAVKLENGQDSTLVLFPKIPLEPGTKYYLYLVLNTNSDEQKRWIQPITTPKRAD